MTCVKTRALQGTKMEGISTPLSRPQQNGFQRVSKSKDAILWFFLAPLCPQPQRNADAMNQRAPESTDTKDKVAQVQCNELRRFGQVRWGPAESRRSFHQLVDRFPFGVDGSLQFPGLPHCLVPVGGLSVVAVVVATIPKGFFETYRADCNSMTSICA